jgi:hypothetical protein
VTTTASPTLRVGTVVISTTSSIVVSILAPQVSSFPSSAPLVIVPSHSPLIISSSSSSSNSSNMVGEVTRFTFNTFGPLDIANIPGQPHALPTTNYVKKLNKFSGNNAINAQNLIFEGM